MNTHPLWHNFFRKPKNPHHLIAELWRETPLFSGIPFRRCLTLSRMMHIREYQKDELIFKSGEIGLGVAMIVEGSVTVKTGDHMLANLRKGDFFGELALVIDETRTANVIAKDYTRLAFFLRPDLEEFVRQFPRYGALLSLNLSKVLGRRLREANVALTHASEIELTENAYIKAGES